MSTNFYQLNIYNEEIRKMIFLLDFSNLIWDLCVNMKTNYYFCSEICFNYAENNAMI